jgi:CDP-diacylglycerol--serine O-phosphatidyltransferase
MKHIPNLITSLNLVSGFSAVIFASGGDFTTASWLILAAMIFDFFDGFSARLLKAYSPIGKELDSLADVVSFGVAPAIIIFYLLRSALGEQSDAGKLTNVLIFIVPAIMPVCAALRLAVFNVDTTQTTTFRGLPTPANAIAVITLIIAADYSNSGLLTELTQSSLFLIPFTIVLSLLMVTRIPLLSLKTSHLRFKGNEGRYILIGLILIAFAILGIKSLPLIIPLYILASIFSGSFSKE